MSFLKKSWQLIAIIFLAAVLNLFWLNRVPPGLNWDEAAIGWNAKTIWHLRLDEFGTRLPISFKSFGDYKAPLYIYLTAPVVGLFGSSELSVRLVSVVAGITSVGIMYFLGGPIAAVLLAISPWHILLSRPALEANLALMLMLSGIWFFKEATKRPILLLASALSFGLSLYSYQSPKIFVPALVLGLIWIYRKKIFKRENLNWLIIVTVITVIGLIPIIKAGLGDKGGRFAMTSIFYQENVNIPVTLVKNYLVHFSPTWLFWGSTETSRFELNQSGLMLLTVAPFLFLGLWTLWKKRTSLWSKAIFWWLIIAPLPAAIGFEVPHPIRAYQLLPVLVMITALGINEIKRFKIWLWLAIAVNAGFFLYHYFVTYPVETASQWQYGYKQVAATAYEWEDKVDKVIITSYYGQPYVFTYWYQDRDPQAVFWGSMIKYLFREVKYDGDRHLTNTLLIGSPEDIPPEAKNIIKEIYFPDGKVAFRVVKT